MVSSRAASSMDMPRATICVTSRSRGVNSVTSGLASLPSRQLALACSTSLTVLSASDPVNTTMLGTVSSSVRKPPLITGSSSQMSTRMIMVFRPNAVAGSLARLRALTLGPFGSHVVHVVAAALVARLVRRPARAGNSSEPGTADLGDRRVGPQSGADVEQARFVDPRFTAVVSI